MTYAMDPSMDGFSTAQRAAIGAAFEEAVRALGGFPSQLIENGTASLGLGGCDGKHLAAYVPWPENDRIQFCEDAPTWWTWWGWEKGPGAVRQVVAHELGHLLGAGHDACDGRNVMCGDASFVQSILDGGPVVYTADDLDQICTETAGGVCAGR